MHLFGGFGRVSAGEPSPDPSLPREGCVPQSCCPGLQTASGFFKRNESQSALQPYGLQFKLEPLKPPERLLPSLGREGRGRVLTPRKQSLSKRVQPRRVQKRSESCQSGCGPLAAPAGAEPLSSRPSLLGRCRAAAEAPSPTKYSETPKRCSPEESRGDR